jgi:hypothetical protein
MLSLAPPPPFAFRQDACALQVSLHVEHEATRPSLRMYAVMFDCFGYSGHCGVAAVDGGYGELWLGRRFLAIHHPWDAELVDQHAKPARPEGLCDRHPNNTAFAKLAEDALGFRRIVHHDAHTEALWFRDKLGRRVASHQ